MKRPPADPPPNAAPASPCVRQCCLDADSDICIGCFRSLVEITGWQAASLAEKEVILQRARQRRADYARRFPGRQSWDD